MSRSAIRRPRSFGDVDASGNAAGLAGYRDRNRQGSLEQHELHGHRLTGMQGLVLTRWVLGESHVATDCDELARMTFRAADDCLGDLVAGGVVTKERADARPADQQQRVQESRFQDAICCVVSAR